MQSFNVLGVARAVAGAVAGTLTGTFAGTLTVFGVLVTCGGCRGDNEAAPYAVSLTVDVAQRHQVMAGFGASEAFTDMWLVQHPHKQELYQLVFADLGLDILRMGNWYHNGRGPSGGADTSLLKVSSEILAAATASLGFAPPVLMSSWSPPTALKMADNGGAPNLVGGTLRRNAEGDFDYEAFGQWWRESLNAYAAAGVEPTWISIQNEPDFVPMGAVTWHSNLFDAKEGAHAGYVPALDAVAAAVQTLSKPPVLIGPEVLGIGAQSVEKYLRELKSTGSYAQLGAVSHHLYGGNPHAPDSYNGALAGIAKEAGDLPRFQTEFSPIDNARPDLFNTAWLIQNSVTVEGVSAYLYWGLTWTDNLTDAKPEDGMVSIEFPLRTELWTTPRGYQINDPYYALKHFSKWVDAGWQRVQVVSATSAIKASGFISPDATKLTLVAINTDDTEHALTIDTGTFAPSTSNAYRSAVSTGERTTEIGPLDAGGTVILPAQGVVTVTLAR